jgi:nucleoside phosphorylase
VRLRQHTTFPLDVFERKLSSEAFFERFYVAPALSPVTGTGDPLDGSPEQNSGLAWNRVVITGPMGAGKSTYLLWLYEHILKRRNSPEAYILGLEQVAALGERLNELSPDALIFVDSLDETMSSDNPSLNATIAALLTRGQVVFACRAPFFYEVFDAERLATLDAVLELPPLTPEEQQDVAKRYIDGLYAEEIRPAVLARTLQLLADCRAGATREATLIMTPLFTTLCTFVAQRATDRKLDGIAQVYGEFLRLLIDRKFGGGPAALKKLQEVAWQLELRRRRNEPFSYTKLTERFEKDFLDRLRDLIVIDSALTTGESIVRDFRHRSIAEYLVAGYVAGALEVGYGDTKEIGRVLTPLFNYETSYFMRRIILELPEHRRTAVLDALRAYVLDWFGRPVVMDEPSVHNALYLFANCAPENEFFIEDLFRKARDLGIDKAPLVLGTLFASTIAVGTPEAQEQILDRVASDEELKRRNINYHLFYYGDADLTRPGDVVREIPTTQRWENTRRVLLERLASPDTKRRRFRAWDLMTLRHLYELNPQEISAEIRAMLIQRAAALAASGASESDKRSALVRREAQALRNTLEEQEAHARLATATLDEVNVGIIAALPEEYAAVCEVFGSGRELFANRPGGGRRYWYTEVPAADGGTHRIAVARTVSMGNNQGTARAMQMMTDCPKIAVMIMVGIAGAVPNADKPSDHVRLGDVVTSGEKGVVKYDFVKEHPDGVREVRSPPRPPAAALLDAVHELEVAEYRGKRPWNEFIRSALRKLGWSRPGVDADALLGDDEKPVAHPADPERRAGEPRVFSGPIASSDTLLKNPAERDRLREAFGVKAVEMEGSGVADASWLEGRNYFIVRGTCDYCDKNKNDTWHPYAAVVAAAYTRALLSAVPEFRMP